MPQYETVVGLEIHVELATKSKIFCGCSTAFGGGQNTRVCPVCMGLPGALPVLNRQAVDFAVRAGLALNCSIAKRSMFDRKHYFYPDLPKAFQISQLYLPLCADGWVDALGKRVRIREIHMEEDAGKLVHDPWTDATLADFNRCGVPLIEIVTQPDMRTPEETVEAVRQIRAALSMLGVSDCKMQEGSLRVDVNLSVRPIGSTELGTRTEMKNINSLKSIGRAVAGEAARQIEQIELGKPIIQQTRRWDDSKGASTAMRSKEDAHDYRYFPEPDVAPLSLTDEWIEERRSSLPELPEHKRKRYPIEYGLSEYDAGILVSEKALCELFERTAAQCGKPKEAANWIMGEVLAALNQRGESPDQLTLSPDVLSRIIAMQSGGVINRNGARQVLAAALSADALDVDEYVKANQLAMVGDESALQEIVRRVVDADPDSVAAYRSGKEKVFGYLMGQAMKALKGKGDPNRLKALLKQALE
ncbi:MAG: Asp-tRNA(Asn)/Glu-tRNA(Gln) amidotransferase subunit GatB [Oscillospiraceae bacterium]|jgi:aspartyl-tRNA(Asn)/glutamyl-tRNA(Gln) amidotransferase subunit B|nr:Asp-tRNA(Asn)/Glu-tRNA(Gln) amidotransferase subunit GatB [Oscillospiraceae bacterium]